MTIAAACFVPALIILLSRAGSSFLFLADGTVEAAVSVRKSEKILYAATSCHMSSSSRHGYAGPLLLANRLLPRGFRGSSSWVLFSPGIHTLPLYPIPVP